MGWGWGNHAPASAKCVAAAFYAGRERRRGNCYTDGERYVLQGSAIARRENLAKRVAYALHNNGRQLPPASPLSYSFAGWPSTMTCRHLKALGVKAEARRVHGVLVALLDGKRVDPDRWYTPAEIEALPLYVEPPRPTRFVNLTMELFPS